MIYENKIIANAHDRNIVKVVDFKVYNEHDEDIALSKNDFAEAVKNRIEPFANIDISGFKELLDSINGIVTSI